MTDMSPAYVPSPDGFSPDDLGHALTQALEFCRQPPPDDDRPAGAPTVFTPTVFALIATAELARRHPEVVDADDDSALSLLAEPSPPMQPDRPALAALEEFLATASWPEVVAGIAVVADIVALPPGAQSAIPAEPVHDGVTLDVNAIAAHRDAVPARLAVGALRNGRRLALVEITAADGSIEVRTHPDLAADLQAAVAAALAG